MADWREYLDGDAVEDGGGGGGGHEPPPWRDWFALAGVPILGVLLIVAGWMAYYTVEAGAVGVAAGSFRSSYSKSASTIPALAVAAAS